MLSKDDVQQALQLVCASPRVGCGSLAMLALTSRALNKCATSALYRKLESPWPLLRLLAAAESNPSRFVIGDLNTLDAARFMRCASEVQEMSFDEGSISAPCMVLASRELLYSGIPEFDNLLPNSKSFFVKCNTSDGLLGVTPWLCKSLRRVELRCGRDANDESLIRCLQHIQTVCQGLTVFTLRLDDSHFHNDAVVQTVAGLDQLSHLEYLCLPADILSSALFERLQRLPALVQIKVTSAPFRSVHNIPSRLSIAQRDQFPGLRILRVHALLDAAAAIVALTSPWIEELHLTVPSLQDADEMKRASHAISHFCSTLEVFTLTIQNMDPAETAEWIDLSPFLRCASLRKFTVQHDRPLPIDNVLVESMLHSWSDLQHLSLNPRPRSAHIASYRGVLPTLDCLRAIATCGHRLAHFGAYMALEDGRRPRVAWHPQDAVKVLDLGRTGGESAAGDYEAARLIRGFFPAARLVGSSRWVKRVAWRMDGFS